jgi:hypothetical protein
VTDTNPLRKPVNVVDHIDKICTRLGQLWERCEATPSAEVLSAYRAAMEDLQRARTLVYEFDALYDLRQIRQIAGLLNEASALLEIDDTFTEEALLPISSPNCRHSTRSERA